MTDNEIIKALECCHQVNGCDRCPLRNDTDECEILNTYALSLINRQKAEIERLTAMVEAAEDYLRPLPFKNAFDEEIVKAKSEAVKEFAERVKSTMFNEDFLLCEPCDMANIIDSLVKEMTEDEGK